MSRDDLGGGADTARRQAKRPPAGKKIVCYSRTVEISGTGKPVRVGAVPFQP
jgi:hypothetical protein